MDGMAAVDCSEGSNKIVPNMKSPVPANWAQKWSTEEDQRLAEGIRRFGEDNWRQVAEVVGSRDAGESLTHRSHCSVLLC